MKRSSIFARTVAWRTALSLALLAGCAAPPKPMNRAQYMATTTRMYPGKTPEQIIEAATAVLTLADGLAYTYAHDEAGFEAFHQTMGVQSMWRLRVSETSGTSKVSVQVNSSSESLMLISNTGGGLGLGSKTNEATMVRGSATYALFWGRMDYMLRTSDTWPTCHDNDQARSAGTVDGNNDALCRGSMNNDEPGKPTARHEPGVMPTPYERMYRTGRLAPDRP